MYISVAETRTTSDLLRRKDAGYHPAGHPSACSEPETYERLRRVEAYLTMLKLAESLSDRGLTASDLFEASRSELEERP
jgi:hypothetical protein